MLHTPTTSQLLAALTVTDATSDTTVYVAEEAICKDRVSALLECKGIEGINYN
jgi:hypothetical protein